MPTKRTKPANQSNEQPTNGAANESADQHDQHLIDIFDINPEEIVEKLLGWQAENGRHDLQWQIWNQPVPQSFHGFLQNFYRAWLAEIMLQQTQVATARPYFEKFLETFADIFSLANASEQEVLKHWQGLGYYSRARYLHQSAKTLAEIFKDLNNINNNINYKKIFIEKNNENNAYQACLKLKGVGTSTAAALASCVFEEPVSIFDGNVRRVLSRIFMLDDTKKINKNNNLNNENNNLENIGLIEIADILVKTLKSNHQTSKLPKYTQSLMDFGALICKPKPLCLKNDLLSEPCIMQNICKSYQNNQVLAFPAKKASVKILECDLYSHEIYLQVNSQKNNIYIFRHQQNILQNNNTAMQIWQGLWLPLVLNHCVIDELSKYISDFILKNININKDIDKNINLKIEQNIHDDWQHTHLLTHRRLQIYPRSLHINIDINLNNKNVLNIISIFTNCIQTYINNIKDNQELSSKNLQFINDIALENLAQPKPFYQNFDKWLKNKYKD